MHDNVVKMRSSLLVRVLSSILTMYTIDIDMQWYDEKRRRIDIANPHKTLIRSNPNENFELGRFLDSISAITDRNNAMLLDIDIKETDCCPENLYLTAK